MSESLHKRMVGCEFSFQIWTKVEIFFASQTRAKVSQLKIQLRSAKKTGTVNEFLLSIKKIVDTLAAVGSPISTEDHIEAILNGVLIEYDSFVTSVL